jgi:hypothetical protein
MQAFFNTHGRKWPTFWFGCVVGILFVVAIKRFNKRMDR